ncbi:PAS domain S-box protein [Sporohalobacter salinus]|uniref:PAS domain S-box protein n=1 Tax=Sporohalobacter salinus TaxID=1494606 RepID=UPI001EF79DB8|nr:HD domain-containing phosphohydrolase [Sporohalobacter salinus]
MIDDEGTKKNKLLSLTWFIIILILVCTFLGCTQPTEKKVFLTETEKDWLNKHDGEIRIAYTPNYPPVEFTNEKGEYVGISADYFDLLEKKLDVKFKMIKVKNWKKVLEKAKNGEIEGITAATKTSNRSKYLNFTDPYIKNSNVIITREDVAEGLTIEELSKSNMKVLTIKGYAINEYLSQNYPNLNISTVPNVKAGLRKVSIGGAYAMIAEIMTAAYYINKDNISNLRITGDPSFHSNLCIASINELPILNSILNKGLAKITKKERKEIKSNWLKIKEASLFRSKLFWTVVLSIICGSGLIIITIIIWNNALKRAVKQKTEELQASKQQLEIQNQQLEATECQLRNEIEERKQAEQKLRDNKESLRTTLNSIGDAVIATDTEGQVIRINPVAEELTGWEKENVIGISIGEVFNIVNAKTREKVDNPVNKVLEEEKLVGLANHTVLISKDGSEYQISDSASPIQDDEGEITGVVLVFRDVTEKYRQQKALRESEEKYRLLFENMTTGFALHEMIYDDKGKPVNYRFLEINSAFERLTGLCASELIGNTVKEVLPDTEQYWINTYGKIASTGKPVSYEDYSQEMDKYYQVWAYSPEQDKFATIISDVTERKKTEQKLMESEEFNRSIVEVMPDTIIRTNREGELLDIIGSGEKLYRSKDELLGKKIKDILSDNKAAPIMNAIEKSIGDNSLQTIEYQLPIFDDKLFWFEARIAASDKNEVFMYIRNITERKKAEEEIKYKSYHSELTGLYNRTYFNEELNRYDTKRQLPLSIIMGDVNGLKITNDTFGHKEGDRLLIKIAEILENHCRQEDLVAHIGGDEYIILLPQTFKKEAEEICSRIKEACQEVENVPIPPSIALGCATKKEMNENIETILKKAEDYMYQNKVYESESIRNTILDSLETMLRETTNETLEHSQRLEGMAVEIGRKLNLSEQELNTLASLADLHDLGKISISEGILQKKGSLNSDEWEKIRRHPELGYKIANSSPKLTQIAEGILCHHERWDGQGYPQGLEGEDIPLLARIITIVDAYDVMTNGRPYKESMSKEEAIEELKNCAGSQFDPAIVNIFVRQILN